jgi:LacI family transcriptional regulator
VTEGRATMQHVANLAGVSLKTVSRVVNGEPGVSAPLVLRVEEAVAKLGYRHNLTASNLRRGQRTASIGMLVQDLSNDYCGQLLNAVEARARDRGVVVMSASLDEEPERERELVARLVSRRIDGLILMPATDDQSYLMPEILAGLAVVVVDRAPRGIALDSVSVDNRSGAADAVRHLAGSGHRRIAFLGDDSHISTAVDRRAGYREAVGQLGLEQDPGLDRLGVRSEAEAERATLELFAMPEPPTAIFAGRNVIAVGAVRALRTLGLTHQVALVGFDDFATADLLEPGVTCVRQAVHDQGETAIDLLLFRLDGGEGPPRDVVLPTTLVERGSGEIPAP